MTKTTEDQMPEQTAVERNENPSDCTVTVPILPILDPAMLGLDQPEQIDRADTVAPDDELT